MEGKMKDIYKLVSAVYDKCQAEIDGLEDKEGPEVETLVKIRLLQSQAADVILDYRREKSLAT